MVEYIDGSIVAQMGITDMRIPISYALSFPQRLPLNLPPLDLSQKGGLTFLPPIRKDFLVSNWPIGRLRLGRPCPPFSTQPMK